MVRYVTLAYGDAPGVYRQSLMLLVSLVSYAPAPYEIIVATDRPECYVWFGTRVDIEYLDAARLRAWRGPQPFSMRQKIECIRAAAAAATGPTVLLDADVLARKPLDSFVGALHAGDLFMHKQEYVLSQSRRAGNRKLWASLRPHGIGAAEAMWNSGVLAVGPRDRAALDEALALYDSLGSRGVRHFATEQLVEGIVLGRTGRLKPADEWFAHYWGNKSGYDNAIACRLADAFIEGLSVREAAAAYRENPIVLPVEVRRTTAEKIARWMGSRR